MYEYNFSHFWTLSQVQFQFTEGETHNEWLVHAQKPGSRMEVMLKCAKDEMLLVNYESPNGKKWHNRLWNGGTGWGEIKLYQRSGKTEVLVDHISVHSAGCEYGEYGS